MYCNRVQGQFSTFYPLTQSVELLHGAAVTLLTLGLCILLQGCHRKCLLQSQHDLIHLQEQNAAFQQSFFIQLLWHLSVHISLFLKYIPLQRTIIRTNLPRFPF